MKSVLRAGFAALAIAAAVLPAHAHEYLLKGMHIEHPWARPTPPNAQNGAVYLTLHEHGDGSDKLVSASTPVAARAELHTHQMDGGVLKMRPVESIAIEQGAVTQLKPGGLHVMLMDLKKPLESGAKFPLTLKFEHAGELTVEVDVQPNPPAAGDHGHEHGATTE